MRVHLITELLPAGRHSRVGFHLSENGSVKLPAALVATAVLFSGCATATTSDAPDLVRTPAQQEGPFYPVEKPEDIDNDLVVVEGLSDSAAGQILLLSGSLLTTKGEQVAGATIEIWQVDQNGIYLHPADPGIEDRDPNFQGYGESVTDEDGGWSFRTINPGYYEPRPRHIHLRVVTNGEVVLTSQIYFSDDPDATGEEPLLVAEVVSEADGYGSLVLKATHVLVLDR